MVKIVRSFPAPASLKEQSDKANGSYTRKEMNVLYTKLEAYKKRPDSKLIQRTLKALLQRESAFAGFKRCYIREHMAEFPELQKYVTE